MVGNKKESESFEKSSEPSDARKASDFGSFITGMTNLEDDHLYIMRGHLLIEERLRELINLKVKKPNALIDARLTFNQLLCIAKALYWKSGSEWLWEGIMKLNSIRNGLSHKVMIKNYDRDIDAFLRLLEGNNPDASCKIFGVKSRLFFAMCSIYCGLSAYLDENCKGST
jgi:hypothetical protein